MAEYSQETVNATFLDVVEQLTFMFGDPEDKNDLDTDMVDFTLAHVDFTGDQSGTLSVAVPTRITADIAANILGLEPEDLTDRDMLDDALGEMLNVVCGHVIMALLGPGANFKLGSPVVNGIDEAKLGEMVASPDFFGFNLDDSPVLLGLTTES